MRIDYKKLRKIHEDNNHTVLQHSRGHTIKIAHSALSPENRDQLKAIKMYGGGEAESSTISGQDYQRQRFQQSMPNNRKPSSTKEQDEEHRNFERQYGGGHHHDLSLPSGMHKGGPVQHFKDGGQAQQPWDMPQQEENMSRMPQSEQPMPPALEQPQQNARDLLSTPVDPLIMGNQERTMANSEQPVLSNPPLPTQNIPNQVLPSADDNGVVGAIGQQQQGIRQEASAIGRQGRQEEAAAIEHAGFQDTLAHDTDLRAQSLMAEMDAIRKDRADKKIDPNHFISSMSAPSKVAAAIGLILGGIGSGITGGENPALTFLNQQIDRDVKGQQMEMDRKSNMLSALNQQFGNLRDATNMARAIQLDHYKSQLDMAAAHSKDPIAQARAMQSSAQLEQQKQALVAQTAQRQALLQGVQTGKISPMHAIPLAVPEKMHAEAFKQYKDIQEIQDSMSQVETAMKGVQKLQTAHNRIMNPLQSKSQINALNLQIGALGKEMFGKLNEKELEMLADSHVLFRDDPETVGVKIRNIQQIMSKHATSPLLETYGIKVPTKSTGFTPR